MPRTTILRRLVDATRPGPTTTLRRHLLTRLRAVVVSFTLFAAAYVGGLAATGSTHGVGDMDMVAPEQGAVAIDQEIADQRRAARLVERHDCWTGDAPADAAGEIPGGVVLAEIGKRPRFYSNDAIVGGALDHLFVESDPTIVAVFGFCR